MYNTHPSNHQASRLTLDITARFDAAVVVHPLAVVVQSSGKRRLILDARITNLYTRHGGEQTSSRIVVAKESAACIGKLLLQR